MKFLYNLLLISALLTLIYGLQKDLIREVQACGSCGRPTPTPTPTITLTPTQTPTMTPTPTPTGTPVPTEVPGQGGPSGGSGGGTSPAGPPICGDTTPPAITLISATPNGAGSVILKWAKVGPATDYTISYGINSNNYTFGVTSTGDTDNMVISSLQVGQNYCFRVNAVNNCMPGQLSNEICLMPGTKGGVVLSSATGGGEVLGLSTTSTGEDNTLEKIDPFVLKLFNPLNFSSSPQRISIPRLGIDLPVQESKIKDGYWTISETSANHGLGTAGPGESGKDVIFAHARESLFANLKNARLNDLVTVEANNKQYTYQVTTIKEVNSNDLEVIIPTSSEQLVLYTCSGLYGSKRLIVTAIPVFNLPN